VEYLNEVEKEAINECKSVSKFFFRKRVQGYAKHKEVGRIVKKSCYFVNEVFHCVGIIFGIYESTHVKSKLSCNLNLSPSID